MTRRNNVKLANFLLVKRKFIVIMASKSLQNLSVDFTLLLDLVCDEFYFNNSSIFEVMLFGEVVGANLSTGCPLLLTKNLAKFHLMSSPPSFCFKYLNNGLVLGPLTSIFLNRSPSFVFDFSKWHTISSPSFSGACPPNWLHGNDNILKAANANTRGREK